MAPAHRLKGTIMRVKRTLAITAGLAAVLALTACSTVAPQPDQVAAHYSGGSLSSKTFQGCVTKRETDGPGEKFYVYPTSQRSYTASTANGSDADPFTVVSQDNVEMTAPISATFTLNTDCTPMKVDGKDYPGGMLQLFHERLGNRYSAYWNADTEGETNADGAPDGWVKLLNFAVGQPLDTGYDRVAQGFVWRKLWNDPTTKSAVEKQLTDSVQALVDQQTGAPAGKHFFTNFRVLIQKPDPTNDDLKKAVASEQANVSKAQSAEAQAKADKTAAEAQIAVARARAESLKAERDAIGADAWIRKYAIDKGMNPFPPPVVAGTAAGR